MEGSANYETLTKREKYHRIINTLDFAFGLEGLGFLEVRPSVTMLTNIRKNKGVVMGIRDARILLPQMQIPEVIIAYIEEYGENLSI